MKKQNLMSVNEVAKETGITIRTLHYYDKIGLLSPSTLSEANYRYYSKEDLDKLQQILFYKEVGFELKDIKSMMDAPAYTKEQALKRHKNLLLLKRKRLDKLIVLVEQTLKGEDIMSFQAFSEDEIRKLQQEYYKEAKERWQHTPAFNEYQRKYPNGENSSQWKTFDLAARKIFGKIFTYIDEAPSHPNVQAAIDEWRSFITEHYYDCKIEIFRGLGLLYVEDERFEKTINSYGDNRLAHFISEAIAIYCDEKEKKQ
jgi:DNA-binding transcriptional MerR regulator